MNSEFTRWLLGVRSLPNDTEGLRLAWERPLPDWGWMLVVVFCVALAVWSYSRLEASRSARIGLGVLRGLLLLLLVILLAGPMIQIPRVFIEPDWAVVLVDRSRSMHVRDAHADEERTRISREEALRETLESAGESWRNPEETRRILWLGFGEGVVELESEESNDALPVVLNEADGWHTRMAPALEEALRRTAGRPLAGVVLISDGRTESPPDRELIRRLVASAGEVHVVPLGSRIPIGDTSVARIEAPRRAFSRDSVPVSVRLESRGRSGPISVSLIDEETGTILDEQNIELSQEDESRDLVLTSPPSLPGSQRWSVLIESSDEDLVPENDRVEFSLELIDRPLRVLFVEGYPRWEYRYLKNLLVREATIESSVMLMSADRDFAQEGNAPIARLPRSAEEFAEYDLIILGDLPAGFLTENQQELIREQVAKRGGGLLFIGGPRSLPSSWDGRPLAELFPFTGPLDLERLGGPIVVEPTESATRLGVLQMVVDGKRGWPEALSDASFGWSVLHWAQRIEPSRLKPTADVLAEGVSVENAEVLADGEVAVQTERTPLVLGMRYGAGQVIYVATDEIWRWRYGRGELIPEQFWVQLLRLLGREAAEDDASLLMRVEPERTVIGRPVRISIDLIDTSRVSDIPETVRVDAIDDKGITFAEFELAATSPTSWGDTWVPDRIGSFTLRLVEPALAIADAETEMNIEVSRPDHETRHADADHELLESIAIETSGAMYAPGSLEEITLPNRSFTTERPLSERIWTSPLALLLLISLATLEWVGRRLVRLD